MFEVYHHLLSTLNFVLISKLLCLVILCNGQNRNCEYILLVCVCESVCVSGRVCVCERVFE